MKLVLPNQRFPRGCCFFLFFFFNIVDLFMRNNIFIYQDANANFPCIILPLQFVKNF